MNNDHLSSAEWAGIDRGYGGNPDSKAAQFFEKLEKERREYRVAVEAITNAALLLRESEKNREVPLAWLVKIAAVEAGVESNSNHLEAALEALESLEGLKKALSTPAR